MGIHRKATEYFRAISPVDAQELRLRIKYTLLNFFLNQIKINTKKICFTLLQEVLPLDKIKMLCT